MTTAAISATDLIDTLRAQGWPSLVTKLLDRHAVLNVSATRNGPTLEAARAFLDTVATEARIQNITEWKGGLKVMVSR